MYRSFQAFLERELNQRFALQAAPIPLGLAYNTSQRGHHTTTIQSWCYQCPALRRIRYTYIDGGETAQIFNSVIYPDYRYNLPIFGADFLTFGDRVLIAIDLQPLGPTLPPNATVSRFLQPIYQTYQPYAQPLPPRHSDDHRYFSPYILFAKTDRATAQQYAFAAYQDYLRVYWQAIAHTQPQTNRSMVQRVRTAHRAYDQYSAAHDPGFGLFASYFGREWAQRFVHEFLFAMSQDTVFDAAVDSALDPQHSRIETALMPVLSS
jgi:15,16-dihydrobiliverdin:ferredoxin oxidoreductase